jgi:hypothetical protein
MRGYAFRVLCGGRIVPAGHTAFGAGRDGEDRTGRHEARADPPGVSAGLEFSALADAGSAPTADCEKSFQRTGVPSANMLARTRVGSAGPLIQIQTLANSSPITLFQDGAR